MSSDTTLREQLIHALRDDDRIDDLTIVTAHEVDCWEDVVMSVPAGIIPSDDQSLDVEFYAGYGGVRSEPLIAYSTDWVYVQGVYDGAEWIAAVPRSPIVAVQSNYIPRIGGG